MIRLESDSTPPRLPPFRPAPPTPRRLLPLPATRVIERRAQITLELSRWRLLSLATDRNIKNEHCTRLEPQSPPQGKSPPFGALAEGMGCNDGSLEVPRADLRDVAAECTLSLHSCRTTKESAVNAQVWSLLERISRDRGGR